MDDELILLIFLTVLNVLMLTYNTLKLLNIL